MSTYNIVRFFQKNHPRSTIKRGLTLEEAKEYCSNPESSSSTAKSPDAQGRTQRLGPWFDGYTEEEE